MERTARLALQVLDEPVHRRAADGQFVPRRHDIVAPAGIRPRLGHGLQESLLGVIEPHDREAAGLDGLDRVALRAL